MPATPPKLNDIIQIKFLDHCEGGDGAAMEFEVFGRVTAVSKKVLQVTSWGYVNPHIRDGANETRFDIVRLAITETHILKAK